MKRNNLTTAILAGITGVAGIASVSNAVNLNPDGTGQVLVYPYYTVNNGLDTLISVVNTTDQSKAIKVRFLEGRNSRECLDFNIFLSPYDVWVAALTATNATPLFSGSSHEGQETVHIKAYDNSCIDPAVIATTGYEFLPYGYDPGDNGSLADGYDNQGLNLSRCTEGHFEMIDMGDITDAATQAGVKHGTNGKPADCSVPIGNFSVGEIWDAVTVPAVAATGIDVSSGGIFGSVAIVDSTGGTAIAYNADAISGYALTEKITDPGDLRPSLSSGDDFFSHIFDNKGNAIDDEWNQSTVQAISAVYMHDSIYGEYVLDNGINAKTEWVVTFPTKTFYVDSLNAIGPTPYEPFTENLTKEAGSCEVYTFEYYDREEQVPDARLVGRPPSPRPPGVGSTDAVFCWETNVLEFENSTRSSGDSIVLGSKNTTHFSTQSVAEQAATTTTPAVSAAYFTEGWIAIHFAQSTDDNDDGTVYTGLPVTGFAVQSFARGNLTDDEGNLVKANYAGLFQHRYSRSIN